MMQSRQTRHISSIKRTLILQQEIYHRHGTNSSCPVERELASLVFYACGGFVGDEFAGGFEIVFRGGEVEGCLAAEVWMGRLVKFTYFIEEMAFKQENDEETKE